jgi:hypothetical protein
MKLCCGCSSSYEPGRERVKMMNEQLKIITAYFVVILVLCEVSVEWKEEI